MKDSMKDTYQLVAEAYEKYRRQVFVFIHARIDNVEEAEDLTQDTFLRLLDHLTMLRPDTVQQFIFTIARNLVFDYLRRHYKRQEIDAYLIDILPKATTDAESRIVANDLKRMEWQVVTTLSPQRRKVYEMSRYEDRPVAYIAERMQLSVRTVENHLLTGRKEVREYLRKCI